MKLFGRPKKHLLLKNAELSFHDITQGQPIEIKLNAVATQGEINSGAIEIQVCNKGTEPIFEVYCHISVQKGFMLFYQDMYLGCETKDWKINKLAPGETSNHLIDIQVFKSRWNLAGVLTVYSLSSRYGHFEVSKDFNFDLEVRNRKKG